MLKGLQLERVLKDNFYNMISKVNTCMVGIVINTDNLTDGFVDVLPLANNVIGDQSVEYPTLYYVPVVMPCTNSSAIVMPIEQGDTVLLVFSQRNIEEFKYGTKQVFDPTTSRMFDINDAIAIAGFNISQESIWNPNNYKTGYTPTSLKITHNIGKDNECHIEMDSKGGVSVEATTFNVNCKTANINASEKVNITSPLISENGI